MKKKLISDGKKCRIFDGTDIIQCFKYRGYNHKSVECRNKEHKSDKCNKGIINKCINCIHMNKRLNLELDENHATLSKECLVHMKKLNAKK